MVALFRDFVATFDDPMTTVQSTNTTATSLYVSEEERRIYLSSLQDESNIRNIPTFIFLLVLAIVGMFGNCLILLVYSRKKKKTATIVFIQSIAAVDLFTNLIVIPVTIYVLFNMWDFPDPFLCKGFLFFNLATASTSAILLLAVAIVRYRKVCVPLGWQVTARQAVIASISIAIVSCLTSIPYTVVHGVQEINTGRAGITGKDCLVDQKYVNTIWPLVVSGVSLLIFLSCCVPLTVMYIRVGITAWRHSQAFEFIQVNEVKTLQNTPDNTEDTKSNSSDLITKTETLDLDANEKPIKTHKKDNNNKTPDSKQIVNNPTEKTGLEAIGRKIANRTTRMLVTISAVYIVTNLTTLILVFVRSLSQEHVLQLGAAADSMYRLFLQIFMVNCAVNPFIYCMCDRNFRRQTLSYLKRLSCKRN